MSKVRINDLAREMEVKSRQILDALTELGLGAGKTHSSSLEPDEADKVRAHLERGDRAGNGAAGSRSQQAIAPKIDLSHISKPGDVMKAILARKKEEEDEARHAHAPARPAPPPVKTPVPAPTAAAAPPAAAPARPEPRKIVPQPRSAPPIVSAPSSAPAIASRPPTGPVIAKAPAGAAVPARPVVVVTPASGAAVVKPGAPAERSSSVASSAGLKPPMAAPVARPDHPGLD
jgi:translation initiation factor IF-2